MKNKEENIQLFLASNEPPPKFMIYGDMHRRLSHIEAIQHMNELSEWDNIIFTFCVPVGGTVEEFIPISAEHADKKITDFKYIIKNG